jgi:Holliday junction resolvasome RuvABC DNA-binding subunit
MKKQLKELQQLNGIGEVLARRLIESSYDSIAKVANAEEKGLARIAGLHPGTVRSIVIQARKKISDTEKHEHSWQDHRRRG